MDFAGFLNNQTHCSYRNPLHACVISTHYHNIRRNLSMAFPTCRLHLSKSFEFSMMAKHSWVREPVRFRAPVGRRMTSGNITRASLGIGYFPPESHRGGLHLASCGSVSVTQPRESHASRDAGLSLLHKGSPVVVIITLPSSRLTYQGGLKFPITIVNPHRWIFPSVSFIV